MTHVHMEGVVPDLVFLPDIFHLRNKPMDMN